MSLLTINVDDFLYGVLTEYLVNCQARLYNSQGQSLQPTVTLAELDPLEIPLVNGYERKSVAFGAPTVVVEAGRRYVQVQGTQEIRWTATGGRLGNSNITHIALITRINNTPRVSHLVAVNPQETSPGSGIYTAAPLTVADGNSLVFTPRLRIGDLT